MGFQWMVVDEWESPVCRNTFWWQRNRTRHSPVGLFKIFVRFPCTFYSGNSWTLCLLSQAFLPMLLDGTVPRADSGFSAELWHCICLCKKESQFPPGMAHINGNFTLISHGTPQQNVVLLWTRSYQLCFSAFHICSLSVIEMGNDRRWNWKDR